MRPAIVIFGAAVRPDGSPSPALRLRVEAALELGRALGGAALYLPTGGQGRFGRPEAEVMADLLVAAGVAPGDIVVEPTGRNTLRSALAVAELLGSGRRAVYVATSGYHMLRCVLLLRIAGVRAQVGCRPAAGASRRWIVRWLWRLREAAAIPLDAAMLIGVRCFGWGRRSG